MSRRVCATAFLAVAIAISLSVFALADVPQGVHLGWEVNDINTTMSFAWYTEESTTATQLLYDTMSRGGATAAYAFSTTGAGPTVIVGRSGDEEGYTYKATATGLEPGATYYFVCGGPDGYTEELMFRTVPDDLDRLRFIVNGDTRQGALDFPEGRDKIAALQAQHDPYFMIHVGDFIERAFDAGEWKEYSRHLQEYFVDTQGHLIPMVPVIGNHEVGRTEAPEGNYTVPETGFYEFEVSMEDARLYYQFLCMPEPKRWYTFDITEDLRFFGLNSETYSNPAYPETEQYDWFLGELATSTDVAWKMAAFHRPPFDEYGGRDKSVNLMPLFKQFGVDVVASGHEHFYARTVPIDGTVHVIPGGGGAPLSQAYPKSWHASGPISQYSYSVFEVSSEAVHVVAFDVDDRLIDEFVLRGGVAGSETFLRTRGATSYAADNTGPAPLIPFPEGSYPDIAMSGRVGNGGLIAAGLAWNCINGNWKLGQYDVLFDIMFQHLNPGATKILWYEGYGVAHNTTACSELVAALGNLGYTVVGDATEPITPDLLSQYDVVVIPQLRFGSSYVGGDPNQLPWEDVEAIKEFVAGGKGLLVMDAHDYGGNSWSFVQNKILEGIGADVALQSDGVYDWVDNWLGRGWHPMGAVDPSTLIGAAYVERTGGTEIELWEISTVAPVPAFFLEKVPAGERTIVDGRRTGADARVIIETLAGGTGYVRIQKEPDLPAAAGGSGYSTLSGPAGTGTLVVVDITTDVPGAHITWPLTIEVYYDQEAFDASGMGDESLLALYYWDTEQGMWRLCPESGVNTDRNCVTAAAYHLTRFAIMRK